MWINTNSIPAKKFTNLFKEEYTYMPIYRRVDKLKSTPSKLCSVQQKANA